MQDNEATRLSAREIGFDQKPSEYIVWVKNNLGRDISNSTVTKTLGKYSDRKNAGVDNSLLQLARQFLLECNDNVYYSKSLLERAKYDLNRRPVTQNV